MTVLTEADLDLIAITAVPARAPFGPVAVVGPKDGPAELQTVCDVLEQPYWLKVVAIVAALERGEGASVNDLGFTLPHEWLEPGDTPRPGVEIYTPLDRTYCEPQAFERLLGRYLGVLVSAVRAQRHGWTRLPEWPRVEAAAERLAAVTATRG